MCKNKDIAIAKLCEHGFLSGDKNDYTLSAFNMQKITFENAIVFKQFLSTNFSKNYLNLQHHEIDFYLKLVEKYSPEIHSHLYSLEDISEIINKLNSHREKEIAKKYLSLVNTNYLFLQKLDSVMCEFVEGYDRVSYEGIEYPFVIDYVADILKDMGVKNYINAQGHAIKLNSILKLPSAEFVNRNAQFYLPLADAVADRFLENKEVLKNFKNVSTTFEFMFSNLPNLKGEYARNTGVWEGYSLLEHTQSVMNFFEKNFAPTLPEKFNALMNLLIFVHDIGKPECFAKDIQKGSNLEFNNYKSKICRVFESLGFGQEFADFVMDILFRSQIFTTAYYVNDLDSALNSLIGLCKNLKTKYNLDIHPDALANLCRILQTCDSGSYSAYSQTQDTKTGVYYTMSNWRFTNNFEKTNLGYRFKSDAFTGSLDNILDSVSLLK